MPKKLIAAAALLCFSIVAILFATTALGAVAEDGLAVPSDAQVAEHIVGDCAPIPLAQLHYGDVIYNGLSGQYVGKERLQLDKDHPMYVSTGSVLRFWGEENWLLTEDGQLYCSYNGLYLSDGHTYNQDMSQADDEIFLLLTLPNGLYMNAQFLRFDGLLDAVILPANSVLHFGQDAFSWYQLKGQTLVHGRIDAVFDATVTIGSRTFRYGDLLKTLGLMQEVIEKNEGYHANTVPMPELVYTNPLEDRPAAAESAGGPAQELEGNAAAGQPGGAEPGQTPDGGGDTGSAGESGGSGEGSEDGGSGGSGSTGDDTAGSAPGAGGTPGQSGGSTSGGAQTPGTGRPTPIPYSPPTISLSDFEPWTYALGMKLNIDDPSKSLYRSLSFTVYADLKNDGGGAPEEKNGVKVYPASGYVGSQVLLRSSQSKPQSFALATLPPATKVYVQYTYRYTDYYPDKDNIQYMTQEKRDEDGNPVTDADGNVVYEFVLDKYGQKIPLTQYIPVTSGFYELETTQGNVQPVKASWTEDFAVSDKAFSLSDFRLENTSAYIPGLKEFDFANFKLDTLPYVNRLEIKLTPPFGSGKEARTVVLGSAVLASAQGEGGTSFRSSNPSLDSNTAYRYTVTALDRFGNPIPLEGKTSGSLYTSKAAPSVTIEEVDQKSGQVTLRLSVTDADGALRSGTPLTLRLAEAGGVQASLLGTWSQNVEPDPQDSTRLLLKNPAHGAVYDITLTSLSFSTIHNASVTGSICLQPEGSGLPGSLPVQEDVALGSLRLFTAPLATGTVAFTNQTKELMDTYATIQLTMNKETMVEILPLVDILRFQLRDAKGNPLADFPAIDLVAAELRDPDTAPQYGAQEPDAYVLRQTDSIRSPRILLRGSEAHTPTTPWQDLLIAQDPDTGDYSTPMTLEFAFPQGSLSYNTTYTYTLAPLVVKNGREYDDLRLLFSGTASFTTRKQIPTVALDEVFLAGDRLDLLGLEVTDPDGTILNHGSLKVQLYYGSTLIDMQTHTANAPAEDFRFTGLIPGEKYTLRLVADAYNDGSYPTGSYAPNHILWARDLVAGSDLYGDISLTFLKFVAANPSGTPAAGDEPAIPPTAADGFAARLEVTVQDSLGFLADSPQARLVLERSASMEQPDYRPYREFPYDMTLGEDGSVRLNLTGENCAWLTELPRDDGYRLTLRVSYQGRDIDLDSLTFRTDGDYIIVRTHEELCLAMSADKDANILVAADFDQNYHRYDIAMNFKGTIDFQGHVVTNAGGEPMFVLMQQGSKVMNLVYDYPDVDYYKSEAGGLFRDCYCDVENLIVRTHGKVEVGSGGLLGGKYNGTSSLRNFVVKLGGDLIVNNKKESQQFISAISGFPAVENGYVYAVGGAGIVYNTHSFSYDNYYLFRGVTKNVFVLADTWVGHNRVVHFPNQNSSNIYAVGDYYDHPNSADATTKSYDKLLDNTALTPADTKRPESFRNVWAISSADHIYQVPDYVKTGTLEMLYDAQWQASVLTSGFDISHNVPQGYYPRLILPSQMERHQEYIPLPILDRSREPQLIGDGWASEDHGLDSGQIVLTFKNDNAYPISNIKIGNLKCEIKRQEVEGELYKVYVDIAMDPQDPAYVSSYHVSEFYYTTTGAPKQVLAGYDTQNIELWKAISKPTEWMAIQNNLAWNYKVVNDIDLGNLTGSDLIISPGTFTGKLDGQEYVLSNLNLTDMRTPCLFHIMSEAVVRNLFFENVTIRQRVGSEDYGSLIRSVSDSLIENVRVKDSYIKGGWRIGGILGQSSNCTVRNCSVVDTVIEDSPHNTALQLGGLAGYTYNTTFTNCYTRDVTILVDESANTDSIGGLAGYVNSSVKDCYAHGVIRAEGSNIGGISGYGGNVSKSFSYVDILQTQGTNAAGIAATGILNTTVSQGAVALGNVNSLTGTADRVGYQNGGSMDVFAYAGQNVSGIPMGEPGPNNPTMVTAAQLADDSYWKDNVRMGTGWDYSLVSQGYAPVLACDTTREGWTQQALPMPGQGMTQELTITAALYDYDGKTETYTTKLELSHPGAASGEELYWDLEEDLVFDGFDLSDASIVCDRAGGEKTNITITTHTFTKALDTYILTLRYQAGGRTYTLLAPVAFVNSSTGNPHHNFWHLKTYAEWLAFAESCGSQGQNVCIDNLLNMEGYPEDTLYRNLRLGRLQGHREGCGFQKLSYDGGKEGLPWIREIREKMEDICFQNCTFDFSVVRDVQNGGTGAILKVKDVSGLTLQDITILNVRNSGEKLGFISTNTGTIDGVTMTNVVLEKKNQAQGNYCGALVGWAEGNIRNVTARNIIVYQPTSGVVGGIVGMAEKTAAELSHITVEGLNVQGRYYVGGVGGNINRSEFHDIKVYGSQTPFQETDMDVVAGDYEVGGAKGYGTAGSSTCENFHVKDLNLTSTRTDGVGNNGVGGVSATGSFSGRNILVENCTMTSPQFAGGVKGSCMGEVRDVKVVNCTVTAGKYAGGVIGSGANGKVLNGQVTDSTVVSEKYAGGVIGNGNAAYVQDAQVAGCEVKTVNPAYTGTGCETASIGAGGIYGYGYQSKISAATVRDTVIAGPANVGGILGYEARGANAEITKCYVAGDVTVLATDGAVTVAQDGTVTADGEQGGGYSAGGILGRGNTIQGISACISGANVKAARYAGGIVGNLGSDTTIGFGMSSCYAAGTVTATQSYAAGFIGHFYAGSISNYAAYKINNCLAAAAVNVTDPGNASTASPWINDLISQDLYNVNSYVAQDSTLNGTLLRTLLAGDPDGTQNLAPYYTSAGRKVYRTITTQELNDSNTYKMVSSIPGKLHTGRMSLDHLDDPANPFYPYPLDDAGTGLAPGIGEMTEAQKIKFPADTSSQGFRVYPASINTANIERPLAAGETPPSTVDVGGTAVPLTVMGDRVIAAVPLKDSLTVDGQVYSGLYRRQTAVQGYHGPQWVLAHNGTIVTGNASEKKHAYSNAGKPLHFWGNQVLTDTGIYTMTFGAAYDIKFARAEAPAVQIQPIWSNEEWQTYGTFSIHTPSGGGEATFHPYQVFLSGGSAFRIHPAQNMVPDSLHRYNSTNMCYLADGKIQFISGSAYLPRTDPVEQMAGNIHNKLGQPFYILSFGENDPQVIYAKNVVYPKTAAASVRGLLAKGRSLVRNFFGVSQGTAQNLDPTGPTTPVGTATGAAEGTVAANPPEATVSTEPVPAATQPSGGTGQSQGEAQADGAAQGGSAPAPSQDGASGSGSGSGGSGAGAPAAASGGGRTPASGSGEAQANGEAPADPLAAVLGEDMEIIDIQPPETQPQEKRTFKVTAATLQALKQTENQGLTLLIAALTTAALAMLVFFLNVRNKHDD